MVRLHFRSGLLLPGDADDTPPPFDEPEGDGEDILSPAEAIAVYSQLLSDERVRFEPKPANLENAWTSLMSMRSVRGNTWTDTYLAAFAIEADLRMITFDQGMRRWPGLALELLIPG